MFCLSDDAPFEETVAYIHGAILADLEMLRDQGEVFDGQIDAHSWFSILEVGRWGGTGFSKAQAEKGRRNGSHKHRRKKYRRLGFSSHDIVTFLKPNGAQLARLHLDLQHRPMRNGRTHRVLVRRDPTPKELSRAGMKLARHKLRLAAQAGAREELLKSPSSVTSERHRRALVKDKVQKAMLPFKGKEGRTLLMEEQAKMERIQQLKEQEKEQKKERQLERARERMERDDRVAGQMGIQLERIGGKLSPEVERVLKMAKSRATKKTWYHERGGREKQMAWYYEKGGRERQMARYHEKGGREKQRAWYKTWYHKKQAEPRKQRLAKTALEQDLLDQEVNKLMEQHRLEQQQEQRERQPLDAGQQAIQDATAQRMQALGFLTIHEQQARQRFEIQLRQARQAQQQADANGV